MTTAKIRNNMNDALVLVKVDNCMTCPACCKGFVCCTLKTPDRINTAHRCRLRQSV